MIRILGANILVFFSELGEMTILLGQILSRLFKGRIHFRNTIDQTIHLGIKSLPITITTSTFVGMVFAMQVVKEFLKFGAGKMIGGVVAMAMWRELAPMLTGVVVAGRIGAAISAELGSMKVTEQIEALEALSQDPIEYLVIPRILACAFMMPLLIGIADIVGFFGGFFVAVGTGRINPYAYINSAQTMLHPIDIYGGLFKGFFFGCLIAVIGSFMGLNTQAGARGVGISVTKAVVVSLITIFVTNYFLSAAIF